MRDTFGITVQHAFNTIVFYNQEILYWSESIYIKLNKSMIKHFWGVQNIQSKHKYLFLNEISYMFRLKCSAMFKLIAKTKR
jgi:hypothetical protein